jgi:hypothetical protein
MREAKNLSRQTLCLDPSRLVLAYLLSDLTVDVKGLPTVRTTSDP